MHVVLAGGGTAGHVEPALALADALRRRDPQVSITALGTANGLEATLVPARGYHLETIPRVPLPRRLGGDLPRLPARLLDAVRRAGRVIDDARADVVVGFGGYVAVPAYLAARRRGVPIVVHEANSRPGVANRLGARLTRHVAVSTPGCRLAHARLVGLPVRRSITQLDRAGGRSAAREHFGLAPESPTLLVFGGSLGARRLNDAAAAAAADLAAAGVQVLHAVGREHAATVRVEVGDDGPRYVTVAYLDRMDLAYAAADVALCRAGAMTCAELAAVGLPGVYVPLPIGNGEQHLNAAPVVAAGGGLLVADEHLSPAWIRDTLVPLLTDPDRLVRMSRAAAGHGRPDADEALADMTAAAAAAARGGRARRSRGPVAPS